MKKLMTGIAALAFSVGAAFAQQEPSAQAPAPAQEGEWKADVGFNAILNTGNSNNKTFGGNALLSNKRDRNKVEGSANGAYGRSGSRTDPANWKAQLRYDRYVLDPLSLFALGRAGQDLPAGFDWRYGGAAGLAHELYKTDPHFFKYEAGYDYARELRNPPPDASVHSARLYLQYKWKISSYATFAQDMENLLNLVHGGDYRINALTSITAKMTDKVALQAGYQVRFDNDPVTGKKKTDTTTQLGIVVNLL